MREEVFGIVVDHQHELVRANVEVMSYRLCHLSLLLADFHDRIQAPISWTDHLKHPLVLRSSFEKCGKIFVWIRVLHGGRVAALTVIDPFIDQRGNGLRAVGSHGARHSPKYPVLVDGTLNPIDRDARTQPDSLFHLNMVTFIAKLSEAGGWKSNDHRGYKQLEEFDLHTPLSRLLTKTF